MRGCQRHGKRYVALAERRQIIDPANQNRLTITDMVCWSRCHSVKTPRPASFIVGWLRMVLPLEFLFPDLIKLSGEEFVVALVCTWVRRRVQLSGQRSF